MWRWRAPASPGGQFTTCSKTTLRCWSSTPNTAKRPQQTPHNGSTVVSTAMVEVIDPTHALYGLRLPLHEIVHHRSPLGHTCAVELSPGIVRLIPVAATDLGGVRQPPSPCRLSVAAVRSLLLVVTSIGAGVQPRRESGGSPATARDRAPHVPTAVTPGAAGVSGAPSAVSGAVGLAANRPAPPGLGHPPADGADTGAAGVRPGHPGGVGYWRPRLRPSRRTTVTGTPTAPFVSLPCDKCSSTARAKRINMPWSSAHGRWDGIPSASM
jgi:hypothetical protein